jgi:hypothetical protein
VVRGWQLLPLLAACYRAEPGAGAPCSAHGECPRDQTCVAGVCEGGGDAPLGGDGMPPPGDAALPLEGWGAAVPVLSTGMVEQDPSFASGEATVYFRAAGASASDDLFVAEKNAAGAYVVASIGAPVDTAHAERSPEPVDATFAQGLYFVSNRNGSFDVFSSSMLVGTYTTPQRDAGLSSSDDDEDVAIAPDAMTAVVSRGDGLCYHYDRVSPLGAWGMPVALTALPSPCGGPTLASGIWVSHPDPDGNYLTAAPVVELNTTARSSDPYVSADRTAIMFERDGVIVVARR